MEDNILCGNTYIPEYATEEPCEQQSTNCVSYEGTIPELSLNNPNLTTIIETLAQSLVNITTNNAQNFWEEAEW